MAEKKFLVDINLQGNQIKQVVLEGLASAPSSPKAGMYYFNTTDKGIYYHDGSNWNKVATGGNATAIQTQLDALEDFVWGTNDTNKNGGLVDDIATAKSTADGAAALAGSANTAAGNAQDDVDTLKDNVESAFVTMFDGTEAKPYEKVYSIYDMICNTIINGAAGNDNQAVMNGGFGLEMDDDGSHLQLIFTSKNHTKEKLGEVSIEDLIVNELFTDAEVRTDGDKTFLVFTFEIADGTSKEVKIDVTTLVDTYTAKTDGGLKLEDHAFSVKLAALSAIKADANGLDVKLDTTGGLTKTGNGLAVDSDKFATVGKVNSIRDAFNGLSKYTTLYKANVSSGNTIALTDIKNGIQSLVSVQAFDGSDECTIKYSYSASGLKVEWNGTKTLNLVITYEKNVAALE